MNADEVERVYLPYRLQYAWEAREAAQQILLDPEDQEIWCVKFSPSGKSIACVGERILKVWDAAGRLESNLASGGLIGYSEVDWSKDGNLLVCGAEDITLKVWNSDTWRLEKVLYHCDHVFSAKFSPDDSLILSGSTDGMAKIWHYESGVCLSTLEYEQPVLDVNFNHYGTLFNLAVGPECLMMYDLRTLGVVQNFTANVVYAKFFPDSRYMLLSMQDGSLSLYDRRNREVAGIYNGNSDVDEHSPNNYSYTAAGNHIVRASVDNCIYIWDTDTQELVQVLEGYSDAVDSVDCHPDTNRIVAGSSDNSITTWTIDS